MPAIIPVIVQAVEVLAAYIVVNAPVLLAKLAVNFAISALVGKLTHKKGDRPSYTADVVNRQLIVRSSIQARNLLYGETITSGPLVFAHSTGTNNEYLHMVIALVSHEVDSIGTIYFNDEEIPDSYLDGSGNVTTGRFAGYARIKKHLGATTQTADSDLVSEAAGKWTTNHRLRGIAYIYVRLKFNTDVYAGGLPNIKARIRGKKIYDPRDAGTRWTDNPALCVRDYLLNEYGLAATSSEVNDTICSASANVCDERVTVASYGIDATFDASADTVTIDAAELRFGTGDGVQFTTTGTLPSPLAISTTYYIVRINANTCKLATSADNARDQVFIDLTTAGSGTHQMVHYDQKRYTANGVLTTENTPRDNMQVLLTAMAGVVPWIQGTYEIKAGAYETPSFALTADDLRAAIQVQTRTPRKDLFNAVKGVYVEPNKYWQPTDFTPVTNATYEAQDGSVRIYRDIELAFTSNQITAQRIGKIHLEKSRQGITVNFPAKIRAIEVKAWDTVTLTIDQLGWSAKVFRVISWALSPNGGVDLTLQEESSASYNWSSGDATIIDAAPDTNLPSKVVVGAPTSLLLDSGSDQAFVNNDGTVIVQILASWTAAADAFVKQYQIEWKLTTDTDYQTKLLPEGFTQAIITPAQEADYDVRVKAVNFYGVSSTYISGTITATGKDTAPGAPSSLAAESAPEAIKLTWTNPIDKDLSVIEIWEASSNDRATAAKVAEAAATFFTRTGLTAADVRYYWILARDTTGNVSAWHPTSSTAGVSGTAGAAGGTVDYADVTGTKPPANADNTTSAVETGITITAGGIVLSSGGAITGGQSDFDTGAGFFLGYSTTLTDYVFSIGNSSSSKLTWDGSTLTIDGYLKNTKPYVAGDNVLIYDSGYGMFTTIASATKAVECYIDRSGTVRVKFNLGVTGGGSTAYAQIYINGTAVGTLRSSATVMYDPMYNSGTPYSEDISVAAGDLLQVYMYKSGGTGAAMAQHFKVCVTEPPTSGVQFV